MVTYIKTIHFHTIQKKKEERKKMARFKKSSLQMLKDRIDLYDVLSSYLDFKKVGRMYKALCPFHDEKNAKFLCCSKEIRTTIVLDAMPMVMQFNF